MQDICVRVGGGEIYLRTYVCVCVCLGGQLCFMTPEVDLMVFVVPILNPYHPFTTALSALISTSFLS